MTHATASYRDSKMHFSSFPSPQDSCSLQELTQTKVKSEGAFLPTMQFVEILKGILGKQTHTEHQADEAESCQVIITAFCYYSIGSIPDILTNRSPSRLFCTVFLGSCDSALYRHSNDVKNKTRRGNGQQLQQVRSAGCAWQDSLGGTRRSPQASGLVPSNRKTSIPVPKERMLH